MTKEELDRLRCANLLEDKIIDITKIEEAYFSQGHTIRIEVNIYERGSYMSNVDIHKDAYPFILDALKKYKLELQQQIKEL
jgi:hypothetical protein